MTHPSPNSTSTILSPKLHAPVSRQNWINFFDKSLLSIGTVAIALSLVFFVAFNWVYMGKIGKFALVESALLICVIGYAVLVHLQKFKLVQKLLLLMASIVTGSLLALVGQVYQTGADTWQLFASWAVLIMPFVLVARLPALWMLWLGLINLTTMLITGSSSFVFDALFDSYGSTMIVLTVINFAALNGWLHFYERHDTSDTDTETDTKNKKAVLRLPNHQKRTYHWSTYLVGIVTTIFATYLGLLNISNVTDSIFNVVTFATWLLIMGFYYWRFYIKQTDLLLLTSFCASLVTVIMALSIVYLDIESFLGAFFLYTLLVGGLSSAAITWLLRIHKQQKAMLKSEGLSQGVEPHRLDATHTQQHINTTSDVPQPVPRQPTRELKGHMDDHTPWYLQLFSAGSGVLSGIFTFSFILILLSGFTDNPMVNAVVGSLLMGIGFIILYNNLENKNVYLSSLAFSLNLAGQAFITFVVLITVDDPTLRAVIIAVMQLCIVIWVPNFLLRLVSSFVALSCVIWLLMSCDASELGVALFALICVVFSLQRHEFLSYLHPQSITLPQASINSKTSQAFQAFALASSIMLLILPIVFNGAGKFSYMFRRYLTFYFYAPLTQGLLICVSLYAVYLLLRRYSIPFLSQGGLIAAGSVVLLGVTSLYVSGLLATCLVIVVAYANQKRPLLALGIIVLVCYIFKYYYQLDTGLLLKSASMLAVGLLLLLIRWGLMNKVFGTSLPLHHAASGVDTNSNGGNV